MIKTEFDAMIKNLRRIKPETILRRAVTQEALDVAADLNRAQLEKGELENGARTGGYKKATVARNNKRITKVTAGAPIKFKNTGKFHKSIKAKITREGELQLNSRSNKLPLAQAYVEGQGNVLGLTDENLQLRYENFVREEFKKALLNRLMFGQ